MKILISFLNKFTENFKNIITIAIIISYFQVLGYLIYLNDILNIIDKTTSLKNILIFTFTAFASSAIMVIIIFSILILLYLFKNLIKVKSNLIIYIMFVFLEILLIIYTFIEINLYKLLGVHIHNDLILKEIKNFSILKKDANINSTQILILILSSFGIFLFSILFYKTIFKRKNIVLNRVKMTLISILFISIFPVIVMFILYTPIVFSFPLFDLIDSSSYISMDIKVNYSSDLNIKIDKPKNIIFIISESTRSDVISRDNTPHIFDFSNREDVINPKYSYSSAHFTLFSIFSMLYSIYGYNYDIFKVKYHNSAILNLLKKYNYKIEFLTASDISYQDSKKMISQFDIYKKFKDDKKLLEYFTNEYNKTLKDSKRPYLLFLFFVETHFNYGFTKEFEKYKPFYKNVNKNDMSYMKKKDKNRIFNRYKNSIYALDYKFNFVLNNILTPKDREDSIIIYTGDHGEQFWEHGIFGHVGARTYYKENIRVPLLIKIPKIVKKDIFLGSHLDIWPTILDNISNISNKEIKINFQGGYSLLDGNDKDKYFIVSTINALLGVKSQITLVNNNGKVVIKSRVSKLLKHNEFIPIKYLGHNDEEISEIKKQKLNQDIKKFEKEHKKYFILNNK